MKKFLILFIALLFIGIIHAQNVGVGTSAPAAKLEIRGVAANPSIPGTVSTGMLRIGVTVSEGIDFGKMPNGSFAGWIQAGYNGTTPDPLVLQPNGGAVGIGTTSPLGSAVLDINSTTQGFLPPRMTMAQRTAILTPAEGLLVYQTDEPAGFYYIKAGYWTRLSDAVTYPSLTICSQQWMDKNLDLTTYRNGDPIPYVTNPVAWNALTTGAWCYYNNDPSTSATYGKLYNWYAVNDPRGLAPAGWHVPTDAEWATLSTCLGGDAVAGGKLKLNGTSLWQSPNTGATNSSGFAAFPTGYRDAGVSINLGFEVWYWCSVQTSATSAWCRRLSYNNSILDIGGQPKTLGFSVRCVRN